MDDEPHSTEPANIALINRSYYSSSISNFLAESEETILGKIALSTNFDVITTQRDAWKIQIEVLKNSLEGLEGWIHFEFVIPRMGHRIDVVLIIKHVVFAVEFKCRETHFLYHDKEQVWDYGLDLKNFHEPSHHITIAPILVATHAKEVPACLQICTAHDNLIEPLAANTATLRNTIDQTIEFTDGANVDPHIWEVGSYKPTPTILEAARALYNNHDVSAISRSDATASNLSTTSKRIEEIINSSRKNNRKSLCFITGVPGAGKTLVGLNIATRHRDKKSDLYSVFLSGNGPLVSILCEALARDQVARDKLKNIKTTLKEARLKVRSFIQNVHHFRDSCLVDKTPPVEHVALFDEAQRAWNTEQTSSFMRRKKGYPDFNQSEPEFLISCLDRHENWAVVICLVGGGQEINTGEAGIQEWISARNRSFGHWDIHLSTRLQDTDYAIVPESLVEGSKSKIVHWDDLHLGVSLRSFRAEHLSRFVKEVLDLEADKAKQTYASIQKNYPVIITRDLAKAKKWLKSQARGSERYGIVVSSQAERLKPLAIDIRVKADPVHWFLNNREDVRSSYYLEDVATEFDVQGLELDWACVVWDGDFRYHTDGWQHHSFKGSKWQRILKEDRQRYLKNAYRVLLTRSRQGLIIVIPEGSNEDGTRKPSYYDPTYKYLKAIGLEEI